MLTVTVALISGIALGFLIRQKDYLLKYINVISMVFMFILLTVLGISLGTNQEIIRSFKDIGIYAVAISVFSIIGSTFMGLFVYRLFFKKNR